MKYHQPCVFLDRDGVINTMPKYLDEEGLLVYDSPHTVDDFEFFPGAAEAIARLSARFRIFVVTNQPGIAYGKIASEEVIDEMHDHLLVEVAKVGGVIDGILHCLHSEKHERMPGGRNNPYYHPNHPDRKPNPGMLLKHAMLEASIKRPIDFRQCYMVGDRAVDMLAGLQAGIPKHRLMLIQAPYSPDEKFDQVETFRNLQAVADRILARPTPKSR